MILSARTQSAVPRSTHHLGATVPGIQIYFFLSFSFSSFSSFSSSSSSSSSSSASSFTSSSQCRDSPHWAVASLAVRLQVFGSNEESLLVLFYHSSRGFPTRLLLRNFPFSNFVGIP